MKRLAVLMLTVSIVACGGVGSGEGNVDVSGDWVLVSGSSAGVALPKIDGVEITMGIEDDTIRGVGACNIYSGDVVVDGSGFSIDSVAVTEMGCQPFEVMELEQVFLAALTAVDTASREGEDLVLTGPEVSLSFALVPPIPDAALVGTRWQLDSVISGDAVSSTLGEPAVLELTADGGISGSTGCRLFSGSYELSGSSVEVTDLMVDSRPCGLDTAGQDGQVLAVVEEGFTYEIDGNRLTLTASGDRGLSYTTG